MTECALCSNGNLHTTVYDIRQRELAKGLMAVWNFKGSIFIIYQCVYYIVFCSTHFLPFLQSVCLYFAMATISIATLICVEIFRPLLFSSLEYRSSKYQSFLRSSSWTQNSTVQ